MDTIGLFPLIFGFHHEFNYLDNLVVIYLFDVPNWSLEENGVLTKKVVTKFFSSFSHCD